MIYLSYIYDLFLSIYDPKYSVIRGHPFSTYAKFSEKVTFLIS